MHHGGSWEVGGRTWHQLGSLASWVPWNGVDQECLTMCWTGSDRLMKFWSIPFSTFFLDLSSSFGMNRPKSIFPSHCGLDRFSSFLAATTIEAYFAYCFHVSFAVFNPCFFDWFIYLQSCSFSVSPSLHHHSTRSSCFQYCQALAITCCSLSPSCF